jgi:inorganic pyrophosphatase
MDSSTTPTTHLDYWDALDHLVSQSRVCIDRPRGTPHPHYSDFIYPLDYGYLEGTTAADGDGIDVWVGSLPTQAVMAVVCTIDLFKRDAEIKLLIGCTPDEAQIILRAHNDRSMSGILFERPLDKGLAE